jgi:hypothetical protein
LLRLGSGDAHQALLQILVTKVHIAELGLHPVSVVKNLLGAALLDS